MDFTRCDYSLQKGEEYKTKLYTKFHNYSNKSKFWTRLTGAAVGVASAGITIATKVSYLAETIFKSLANIFGAAFSKKFSFKEGVRQLFDRVPDAAFQLACAPLYVVTSFVITTLQMLFNPEEYTAERMLKHNAGFTKPNSKNLLEQLDQLAGMEENFMDNMNFMQT